MAYTKTQSALKYSALLPFLPVILIILVLLFFSKTINKLLKPFFSGIGNGLSSVTDAVGITTSQAETQGNQAQSTTLSCWSPLFVDKYGTSANLYTQAYTDTQCKIIYDNLDWTPFTSDTTKVIGAIKTAKSKSQISHMVKRFQALYNKDLAQFLRPSNRWFTHHYLNDTQWDIVTKYVNSLPL